jgi:hypothetical protein
VAEARGTGCGADLLCELGPPPYAITGPDGTELPDRWQDALVMKDTVRALWQRIVDEDARDTARRSPKLRGAV